MEIEDRINELENFQKKWKFYFWATVIISSLAGLFFGFQANDLSKTAKTLQNELANLEERLSKISASANQAESNALRAFTKAGDLEHAISEAQKASNESKKASVLAEEAAKGAALSATEATNYSREASAIARVAETKLRETEKILASYTKSIQKTENSTKPKALEVEISGNDMTVRFEPGVSPYEKVSISQSWYTGVVYVPEGYIAHVRGKVLWGNFYVSKELKGRVISHLTGSDNRWTQEK